MSSRIKRKGKLFNLVSSALADGHTWLGLSMICFASTGIDFVIKHGGDKYILGYADLEIEEIAIFYAAMIAGLGLVMFGMFGVSEPENDKQVDTTIIQSTKATPGPICGICHQGEVSDDVFFFKDNQATFDREVLGLPIGYYHRKCLKKNLRSPDVS